MRDCQYCKSPNRRLGHSISDYWLLQPFGGAFTAKLTAPPKTGAPGCYIQIFTQQGCGLTLQNQYHGFPFDGLTTGSQIGCASPPVQGYGALQITCG